MNRRGVLAAGVHLALLLPVAALGRAADPAISARGVAAVYDPQYGACRDFARALAGRGAQTFAVDTDLLQLWRGPLRGVCERIASAGGCIEGLTTYSDFLVLRVGLRERELRVLRADKPGPAYGSSPTLISWVFAGADSRQGVPCGKEEY